LGVAREATARLRHVAHIGVGARAFSFLANGLDPRTDPIRVELAAPDSTVWTWGPADADARVSGPALDFCLLVTQRRHRDDTSLIAEGSIADQWLSIAQAFAGPPGGGRAAGQFAGVSR
ncbi:TIGR03084 family protein, partial [Mycobacteriaceae bacterium Msp059]|nr:TIGR03084 family protein [Mycobacteriaceae bacterium Msp059]